MVTLQAGVSDNSNGKRYDKAHSNLLFNGYNNADYINASRFFKSSSKNAGGLYKNTPIKYTTKPTPLISRFIPAFK